MSINSGENVETIVSPMASLGRKQPPAMRFGLALLQRWAPYWHLADFPNQPWTSAFESRSVSRRYLRVLNWQPLTEEPDRISERPPRDGLCGQLPMWSSAVTGKVVLCDRGLAI